jgi:hypothetical protein
VSGYDATSFGARFLQDADEQTQRQAWERVTRSVELATGHHPFISRPDLVVDEVQTLLRHS